MTRSGVRCQAAQRSSAAATSSSSPSSTGTPGSRNRADLEAPLAAVGLGVQPPHQRGLQNRQAEITVAAFCGRGVTLDRVVEIEQLTRAGAVPDERIEGGEQRGVVGSIAPERLFEQAPLAGCT